MLGKIYKKRRYTIDLIDLFYLKLKMRQLIQCFLDRLNLIHNVKIRRVNNIVKVNPFHVSFSYAMVRKDVK